jgi:hypothetical protein
MLAPVPACTSSSNVASWVSSGKTTSGTNNYVSTGLTATLDPEKTYAFYAVIVVSPGFGTEKYNLEVHSLPAGASLVTACSPLSFQTASSSSPSGCTTNTGVPLTVTPFVFASTPPVYEAPGAFGVVRTGASGGTLQIDFACVSACGTVTVKPGSFLVLQTIG